MGALLSHVMDPEHMTLHVILFSVLGMLTVTLLIKKLTGSSTNPPPGPRPLPFIGNVFSLSERPHQAHITFDELSKKYGDVMGLQIFSTPLVVLSSVEVVKEAFQKHSEAFSSRPESYLVRLAYKNAKGIVWQGQNNWRPMRRFTLTALKDFGFGKKSMDEKVMDEGTAICKVISEYRGEPFDPSDLMRKAASNIICAVCFGSRFDYNNKAFMGLLNLIDENMSTQQLVEPVDYCPILQWLPLSSRVKGLLHNLDLMNVFNKKQIEEHRPSFDKNNLRDFTDLYLEKEAEGVKEQDDLFSEINMNNMLRDLFIAGSETTSTTLRWSLLYLISYPKVQQRIAKEIEEVVGSGVPTAAHKADLKYLQAFMMEVWRHASLVPSTLPHLCEADTTIGGYTIAAGSVVLGNLYSIHMSERYWCHPEQFNPDRFIGPGGELLTRCEGLMPFGTGSRQCIGESMARTTIFISIASIVQSFTLKMADEANPPHFQGSLGITLTPALFKLCAIPK